MVTYYNKTDMIQFTNYVLKQIEKGEKNADPSGNFEVTHADWKNWLVSKRKAK